MAIESVATAMQAHVITDDEMLRAYDANEQVSPMMFPPYRKMVDALVTADAGWNDAQDMVYRIKALFAAIEKRPEGIEELAGLGKEIAAALIEGIDDICLGLQSVAGSATKTVPRKGCEDSSAPDDRVDAEVPAREGSCPATPGETEDPRQ